MYPKSIRFNILVSPEFLNFFEMRSTPKLSKYIALLPYTNKAIQLVPIDLY